MGTGGRAMTPGAGAAAQARDERGGGTILTLALCLGLLAVATAAAVVVNWVGTARAAQNAADLAALAGAAARAEGADACRAAAHAAEENAGHLITCRVAGDWHAFAVHVAVAKELSPVVPGMPAEVAKGATAGTG